MKHPRERDGGADDERTRELQNTLQGSGGILTIERQQSDSRRLVYGYKIHTYSNIFSQLSDINFSSPDNMLSHIASTSVKSLPTLHARASE